MGTMRTGANSLSGAIRRKAGVLALAFIAGGLTAVALDPTLVRARDDGALDFITRNAPAAWRSTPARPAPVLAYAPIRTIDPFERALMPPGGGEGLEPARRRLQGPSPAATNGGEMSHRRTVCVRMCDGFVFPSSDAGVGGSEGEQLQSCQAACPTATVKLFSVPAGTDDFSQAVASDGQRYGRLPMAFAYTRQRDKACTCRGDAPGVASRSPLEDRTLRAGDIVVMDGRPQVFTGGERARLTSANFRDLSRSGSLSSGERSRIDERLGLSQRAAAQRELQRLKAKGRASDAAVLRSAAPASPELPRGASGVRVIAGATSVPAR